MRKSFFLLFFCVLGVSLLITGQAQRPGALPGGDGGLWSRRPPEAGNFQSVLEVTGLDEVAAFFDRPSDPGDLRGHCEAKRQAVALGIRTLEARLRSLGADDAAGQQAVELAWSHRSLGLIQAHEGQMARAVEHLEAAYRIAESRAGRIVEFLAASAYLEAVLGVVHLRRGELENCIDHRHALSCIFPIRPEARHAHASGSEAAVGYFTRYLQKDPDNLEIRWLLNIAYMTLGRYPADVPRQHLIPPDRFPPAAGAGPFRDVAMTVGLGQVARAGGAIIDDFTNNGHLDIVVSSVDPCEPVRFFRNEGDGTFREMTRELGLADQLGGINIVQADYDNDGWLDLFVMRGGWEYPMRNSLLRNDGGRRFVDVTEEAGLAGGAHRTHSAAWADFDNDGWLDLFVGHEETPAALYRNQGDGTFRDIAAEAGVGRSAFTKGAVWGDFNGDGYPDLYVSNYTRENFLYENRRDGTFVERAQALGVDRPIMSFPAWFWDYDNDGHLDLFVASFVPSVTEVVRGFLGLPREAETMKLYRNTGAGGFEDVTAAAGLDRVVPTMGANFGDVDNDGYLDFYLGTGAPSYAALMPNFLFRNEGGRRFVDVTVSSGTGHLQKGHGVAFGDLRNAGVQDMFANIGGFMPGDAYGNTLFTNPGTDNNWIRIRLIGVRTNRAAIGARITLTLENSGTPSEIRMREVTSGGSFGASPLAQHIGLGRARRIKTLEVYWPASRTHQTFGDVAGNQIVEITEGQDRIVSRRASP